MTEKNVNIPDAEIERLRESKEHFRRVVELVPHGISIYQDGRIVYVNPAGMALVGATDPSEVIGKPIHFFVHSDSLADVEEKVQMVGEGILIPLVEEKLIRLDGSVYDAEIFAIPTTFNGRPAGQVVIRDITKRKQAEAKLQEKEHQYRNLADSGLAMIWTAGTDKRCNYFNEPWLRFTGRTLEQELGNGWVKGVHPDDLDRCYRTYATAFDRRERFDMEYRLRHADGEYRWIRDLGTPNYAGSGEFVGYIGHCLDITAHKNAENALRESQALYQSFVENMPAGVFRKNQEGRFIFVNSMFCRLKGLKMEEVLGKTAGEVYNPNGAGSDDLITRQYQYAVKGDEHHAAILRTGKSIEIEESYPDPDGSVQHLHVIKSPVISADGVVVGSQGILFDITRRKKAEEALRNSENKYRMHIQMTPLATIEYDLEARITSWNPAAEQVFGFTAEEAIGQHTNIIVPEEEVAHINFLIKEVVFKGGAAKNTNQNLTKSGKIITCEWYNSPLFGSDGKLSGMAAFAIDITERKAAELALRESEARFRELNAAKDKFFSIIAHDLKSPFNAILGFSDLLVLHTKAKEYNEVEQYAEMIQQSALRATELLGNLLEWSLFQTGRMSFKPGPIDIGTAIRETLTLLKDSSRQKNIGLAVDLPSALVVTADKNMISVVLRNLISNAVKFTYPGGQIVVSAIRTKTELVIKVKDSGVGIREGDLDKIFRIDENFSTPGTSNEKGTGLGLVLCREFVEKHQGRIWVTSEPGNGSEFCFTIPYVTPGSPVLQA